MQAGLPCKTDFVLGVFGGGDAFAAFHACEGGTDLGSEKAATNIALSEAAARARAEELIGAKALAALPSVSRADRDGALALLKEAGLSVRQIERITGIGRNIIQRATAK
ncbi:MAG: hypothetical protein Q4E12_07245 [Coriobacteriia bacterium]|nr:hypothetical protein [Coriobacteriia bacterium]